MRRRSVVLCLLGAAVSIAAGVPIVADSLTAPDRLLPDALRSYATDSSVGGTLAGRQTHRMDLYWIGEPFRALLSLPDGKVLTLAVYPSAEDLKSYCDETLRMGILIPAEGRWTINWALPFFSGMEADRIAFRMEFFEGTSAYYARLRPGIPAGEDPVYRWRGGFQAYLSVSPKLLRASKFLKTLDTEKRIAVVDGFGTSIAEYSASSLPDPAAIEIITRYQDDGFNSVWGLRPKEGGSGGWKTLWLSTARQGSDGTRTVKVEEVPGVTESDLGASYYSPDVDGKESPTLYFWRRISESRAGRVSDEPSIFELCSWSPPGAVAVFDRYATVRSDDKLHRLDWDAATKAWKEVFPPDKAWMSVPPAVCVPTTGGLVVSRADGTIRLLR